MTNAMPIAKNTNVALYTIIITWTSLVIETMIVSGVAETANGVE